MKHVFCVAVVFLIGLYCINPSQAGTVSSTGELIAAVAVAEPGDVITIAPGTYTLDRLNILRPGTMLQPITVRAETLGEVHIIGTTDEIIKVMAPYWTFENLDIGGNPMLEHAFHIVGPASHTIVRHNLLHDFDAEIKGNGEGKPAIFPTDVLIEGNYLIDTVSRTDGQSVTPIDVVGGQRWILRDNFIADFHKDFGIHAVSYGAFLKGNASDGLIERNLVICEWKNHKGGIRVGLSLGGGGTGEGMCEGDCETENRDSTMRNNIVMNCPEDIGMYLNKSKYAHIYNNTLYNVNGMDVRFSASSAAAAGNVMSGGMRTRDDGVLITGANYLAGGQYSEFEHRALLVLQGKIFGAAEKHPSIFSAKWAATIAGWVDGFDHWLGESRWGRGTGQLDNVFADPASGDFTLRAGENLDAPKDAVTVPDDFCGHARTGEVHSFGAIEYSAGPCDVRARIKAAEALLAKAIL